MKILFILASLLLTLSFSSAQQTHQPPAAMTFSQNYLLLRNQSPKFLYSWNWSNGPRALNQRYKMNGYHTRETFNYDYDENDTTLSPFVSHTLMPDSIEFMWSPAKIHHDYQPFDAMAALWYPWLNTSDSSRNFKGFRNDKSGACLPFLQKNTSVGSLDSSFSGGQTRYAWRLNANSSIPGLVPAFSKPWLGNEFVYRSGKINANSTDIFDEYNTRQMYLSINLRRLGIDTLMNNDTLMVLRLPYRTYNNVTSYLSFDSVPNPLSTITTARGKYRGSMWNTSSDLTTFVLRRNMLPRSTDSAADITLNVMFFADNTVKRTGMPNAYINPRFNIRWGGRPAGVIDSIGIEAEYMPKNGSLSVQWVKLETPNARRLFFGSYDTHIAHEINRSLDSLHKYNTVRGTHHRIRRFYGREEFLITEWQANRYYNIYLDTLLSSEYGIIHKNHIAHATLLREQWNGNTFQISSGTPAPYSRALLSAAPLHKEKTLGIAGRDGYVSMTVGGIQKKHNDYEAQFRALPDPSSFQAAPTSIYSLPLPPMTDSFYRANIVRANGEAVTYVYPSVLQSIEGFLYTNRYLSNDSYIFDKQPWWANVWASNSFYYSYASLDTSSPNHFRTVTWDWGHRPFTGEELRYAMWNSIILGAKGFHIWQGGATDHIWNIPDSIKWNVNSDMSTAPTKSDIVFDSTKFDNVRITNNPNQILDDPDIGTDFIDSTGGRNDMFTALYRRFFKFPDSAYHSAMRMNKIYAGFRSMRHIIDQIFTQLRRCDTTLLNLQLESWYAKGLRDYDLGNVSLLTQYIDTNRTKHRIAKMNGVRDSWDSSFYDITMFSHTSYDTDSIVYLGVQNRRTNSLIIDGTDTLWYSTKDFQDSVAAGKYNKYAQLGSRTISIPLKNTGSYYLIRIRELGTTLDTIIGSDKPFVMNYLPGEGKIFRLEKVPYSNPIRKGHLAHSNQRKIVGYPIYRKDSTGQWTETDSMYYHAVYHRWDNNFSGSPDQSVVFYSRSKPMPRGLDTNRTTWDSLFAPGFSDIHEIPVSQLDHIYRQNGSSIERRYCAYPAVVVRRDSLGEPVVYIVYTCHNNSIDDPALAWVCESRLPAQGTEFYQSDSLKSAALIETYTNGSGGVQEQLRQWGTPMINASANGNFYCWSDSLQGIGYGWKHPNARFFNLLTPQINYVAWGTTFNQSVPGTYPLSRCKHPSLNSYSRIALDEDNCSLVWQEQNVTSGGLQLPRIHYARLRLNQWGIPTLYLPQQNRWSYQPGATALSFHPMYPIAALSTNGCAAHRFPVVYREVHDGIMSGNRNADTLRTMLWEHIYFEYDQSNCSGFNRYPNTVHSIVHANIDLYDRPDGLGRMQPDSAHATVWSHIWCKPDGNLFQPDATQGAVEYRTTTTPLPLAMPVWLLNQRRLDHINVSNYALNLNFIQADASGLPSANALIWQLPHNRFTITGLGIIDITFTGQTWAQTMTDNGQYPHLAARPSLRSPADWQRGRRIFEADDSIPPTITASVERLAKRRTHNEAVALIGYGSQDYHLLLSPLDIQDDRLYWNVLEGKDRQTDTLATPWFRVGKDMNFALDILGGQMEGQTLIEHKETKRHYPFPITMTRRGTSEKRHYTLLDGDNDYYRIIILNGNSAEQSLQSHTLIRPEQEPFQKENTERTFISLDPHENGRLPLRLYPNPANDELSVVWAGGKATVEMIDSQGFVVYTSPMTTSITLSTKELPSGVYMIRLTQGQHTQSTSVIVLH